MNRNILALIAALLIAATGAFYASVATAEKSMANKYAPSDPGLEVATFAGGCFWCVESGYEKIPGVVEAVSGYAGGDELNPTYQQVSSGRTGHTEAVQVYYDPSVITYEGLLQGLWRMMNPTDAKGQFVDRGEQYRPAIFYENPEQKRLAEAAKKELQDSGVYDNPVVIEITPLKTFYAAEEYHQDYYKRIRCAISFTPSIQAAISSSRMFMVTTMSWTSASTSLTTRILVVLKRVLKRVLM